MLHAPLVLTTAKLDISLLLKSSPTPPPVSPAPAHPPFSRPTSIPPSASHHFPPPSSHRTSTSSGISAAGSQAAASTPSQTYSQPQRPQLPPLTTPSSYPSSQVSPRTASQPLAPHHGPGKRPPPTTAHPSASPAKKQSKWTPEEDTLMIGLRNLGMKWEDISKRLPGRSSVSCRLHYQNYLERRSDWDEERKNRLARLYERLKHDMWRPLAIELGVPWRAAEAMHWQVGVVDMARRAGVVPFLLASAAGSSSLAPAVMLPSGMGSETYVGEEPSRGSGYFVEGVQPRTSFVGGENLGRLARRGGFMEGREPLPIGAAGGIDVGGSDFGGGYSQGAVLPGLAELERGISSSQCGVLGDPSAAAAVRMGRRAYHEEDRRGRP